MISSVSHNPPDGTQHVSDGPAPATETQFVPDGAMAPATSTQFVPDGTMAPATDTQFVPDGTVAGSPKPIGCGVRTTKSRSPGDQTQHVADLPRFGRFRALAELGGGAMGTVYRAQDEVLGRAVAIKALHSREAGTRERFLREARAIGAVLHPNILAVYDAGTDDNQPYLVMELAAGGSLRERIMAGPLSIEVIRELGIQIARALAAAHAAKILHRDIKPANILAANDVWKLADFGIARLPDSTLTVEGQFLGSPSYAAPESLRAGQFSPASDVYGLGATLYEALTGVPPHGDHDMQSLVRKLEQDPPPVRTRRPVPAPIERAIMATLARDPAKRPTAEMLAYMLANTSDEPVARPPSPRTKAIALALAAIAIVVVIIALTRTKPAAEPNVQPMLDPREQAGKPRANETQPKLSPKHGQWDDSIEPKPAPEPSAAPEAPLEPSQPQPQIVDQYGNPVDDETAKQLLEQMKRDADSELEQWGRKRGKRRRH
jgi:serine/threonine protein kinase